MTGDWPSNWLYLAVLPLSATATYAVKPSAVLNVPQRDETCQIIVIKIHLFREFGSKVLTTIGAGVVYAVTDQLTLGVAVSTVQTRGILGPQLP